MHVLIALLCMYGGKVSAKEISVQSPDGSMVKIAGTAMTERKGGGIFHCCVLFDCDLQVMEEVLTPAAAKFAAKGIASVRSRVANLKDLAPQLQSMSGDGFFETWADYLSERCEFDAVTTAQEKEETEKLIAINPGSGTTAGIRPAK